MSFSISACCQNFLTAYHHNRIEKEIIVPNLAAGKEGPANVVGLLAQYGTKYSVVQYTDFMANLSGIAIQGTFYKTLAIIMVVAGIILGSLLAASIVIVPLMGVVVLPCAGLLFIGGMAVCRHNEYKKEIARLNEFYLLPSAH